MQALEVCRVPPCVGGIPVQAPGTVLRCDCWRRSFALRYRKVHRQRFIFSVRKPHSLAHGARSIKLRAFDAVQLPRGRNYCFAHLEIAGNIFSNCISAVFTFVYAVFHRFRPRLAIEESNLTTVFHCNTVIHNRRSPGPDRLILRLGIKTL